MAEAIAEVWANDIQLDEGKMKTIATMFAGGSSPEEIAKKMKLPLSDRIPTGPLMSEICLASILLDQILRPSMVTTLVYSPSVSVTDAPKRCAFWVAAVMPRGFKGTRPSCR